MYLISGRSFARACAVTLMALPSVVMAQRGGRGGRGGGEGPAGPVGTGERVRPLGPNPIAPLIDMRQDLGLTPRQVAALDSIERALLQRNRAISQRLQGRRDSLFSNRNRDRLTPDDRLALRSRLDSLAPLREQIMRNDSTASAAALRVLTDDQRTRVRELQAERRGYAMGRIQGRRGGGLGRGGFGPRGQRVGPGRGMDRRGLGGRMGQGFEMGPRGFGRGMGPPGFDRGMGPRGFDRGIRPRRFAPDMSPLDIGPRMDRRGPGGDVGPPGIRMRRRMLGDSMPPDSALLRRPGRRPPPADTTR